MECRQASGRQDEEPPAYLLKGLSSIPEEDSEKPPVGGGEGGENKAWEEQVKINEEVVERDKELLNRERHI